MNREYRGTLERLEDFREHDRLTREGKIAWCDAPSAQEEWNALPEPGIEENIFEYLKNHMAEECRIKEREILRVMKQTGLLAKDIAYVNKGTSHDPKWQVQITGIQHSQEYYNRQNQTQLEFYFIGSLEI